VRKAWKIAIVALMKCLEAEQVSWGAGGGGGSLGLPGEGRGIVGERVDGTLTTVGVVDQDVVLGNSARQLQIGVGDSAGGVGRADEGSLDGERERGAPEEGNHEPGGSGNEDDTAHAGRGSVGGAKGPGVSVNNLAKAGGTGMEVADEPSEVVEKIVHERGEPDSALGLMAQGLLEEAEEAP
jgi:hypothetical protein